MLGALTALKDKTFNYFRGPSTWRSIFEKVEIRDQILKLLDLDDILQCRIACKRMNESVSQALEQSESYCFAIDTTIEENSTKNEFKIRSKIIQLKNVSTIEETVKWLTRVNTAAVHEVEMFNCILVWTDILGLLHHFENMDTLKIVARDENFVSLYPCDINEKDKKAKDEKRFKFFLEKEEVIIQGLPQHIAKPKRRKLKTFYHESQCVYYSAFLLKILPIIYENIEEFSLYIGNLDLDHKYYKSVPYLFASLSNCLVKNASSLKTLVIDSYCSSSIVIDRNQRLFFKEFSSKPLVSILNTPLENITHLSLSFANPNFYIDENRNKLRRFIKTLTSLKNIQLGPIQTKKNFEILILGIVPRHVNCVFTAIYMFQREPRSLLANNFSYSDVSFKLTRTVIPLVSSMQEYNFKNYLPENVDFEKTMISEVLPLMTILHIDQNPVVDAEMRLFIQDREMQMIISRGTSIKSLSLRCNLKLLTDSGLTGLTQRICNNILEQFKLSNDAGSQALNARNFPEIFKTGLGVSLSSMANLESLTLYDAGERVTDATAFISIFGMPKLKSIIVTSPKLTEMGLQAIRNSFPAANLEVEWHP